MVRITIRNLQKKVFVYPQKIKEIINRILKEEKIKGKGEITICFINDTLIRKLNKKYLKKDSPTDVLAFNIADPKERGGLYADILISTDTALRNAKTFNTTPLYELKLYSIHGLLHLLGYDHEKSLAEQRKMEKLEKEILAKLGIKVL